MHRILIGVAYFLVPIIAFVGCSSESCVEGISGDPNVRIETASARVAWDIQAADDGGWIVAGNTSPELFDPPEDAVLVKTDASGTVEWARSFGGDDIEEARSVQVAGDGGYIMAGHTGGRVFEPGGINWNPVDILLLKTDTSGNEVWSKTLSPNTYAIAYACCVNTDGTIVIAGNDGLNKPGDLGALVVKLDEDGNELWSRRYRAEIGVTARDIVATSDGGYAFVGYSEQPFGDSRAWDLYVARLDAEGNRLWHFQGADAISFSGDRFGRGIVKTQDGGFAVVATAYEGNAGTLFVVKFSVEGALEWVSEAPGTPYAEGHDLIEAEDGSLVAAGTCYGLNPFPGIRTCQRFFAARFSAEGSVLWTGRFRGGSSDSAYALALGVENFVLAGESFSLGDEVIRLVGTDAGLSGADEGQ